jgi:SAM-dependent methyltransferase
MSHQHELDRIADRYAKRRARPDRFSIVAEDERLPRLLRRIDGLGRDRASIDLLEIGCGSGRNLLHLIAAGFSPERLVGNELLPDRVRSARRDLPGSVRVLEGDAASLELPDASFDVVFASTVFSSILDDSVRRNVADSMWRMLRPGGAILWYDFAVDNPRNPDVRGVPDRQIGRLFPEGECDVERITLAPPIARLALRAPRALGALAYRTLAILPMLRTHRIAWIAKPVPRTAP